MRTGAHSWVDPHTIDSLFFVFPCKINKLLKSYEYQLIKRWFSRRLEGFKVSSWFLKIVKLVEYRIAKKCHDFHHCCRLCRWLQKCAKEGKREGSACYESRCFCQSPQSPSFFLPPYPLPLSTPATQATKTVNLLPIIRLTQSVLKRKFPSVDIKPLWI